MHYPQNPHSEALHHPHRDPREPDRRGRRGARPRRPGFHDTRLNGTLRRLRRERATALAVAAYSPGVRVLGWTVLLFALYLSAALLNPTRPGRANGAARWLGSACSCPPRQARACPSRRSRPSRSISRSACAGKASMRCRSAPRQPTGKAAGTCYFASVCGTVGAATHRPSPRRPGGSIMKRTADKRV